MTMTTATWLNGRVSGLALALCPPALLMPAAATAQSAASVALPTAATPADAAKTGTPRAETDAGGGDIVVTARSRNETLLSVPVTVSALTSEGLARYSSTDLTRIGDRIPQVQITRFGSGSGALLYIRGIGSSYGDSGIESAVSVNIDGAQLSRGLIVTSAFFDLKQVEVLKGPQALFFGKNSPAGVVSLKSEGPGDRLGAYVKAGYEFRAAERYVEGAIGGPITDAFGVRVAFRASDMDGWLKNTAGPIANPNEPLLPLPGASHTRQPNGRSIAGRLTADFHPSDALSAVLKVTHTDFHDSDPSSNIQVVSCAGRTLPTTLGRTDPYGDCVPDDRRSSGNAPVAVATAFPLSKGADFYQIAKATLASLTVNYQLAPALSLRSTTGFYQQDNQAFGNFDYSAYNPFPALLIDFVRNVTQEVRVVSSYDFPLNFTVGGYYENARRRFITYGRGGFGFPVPFDPNFFNGASIAYEPDDRVNGETISGFGQLQLDLTKTVQLAGGVRFTRETKDATLQNVYVGNVPNKAALSPVGRVLSGHYGDSNWSPEATLTWHPAPEQTLYAAYKTGYKSGGFSTTSTLTAAQTIASVTFGPETARGEEIGYKGALFDRRLTITSAIYTYRFNGLQRTSLLPATTSFIVRNAAVARTRGAEFEANYRVSGAFGLRAAVAYNDARFLSYPGAVCYSGQTAATGCTPATATSGASQDRSGARIALAPEWTLNGGYTFDTPINDRIGLGVTGDVRYVSSYRTQDDGTPNAFQKGYAKLNGSVRLHERDDRWALSLIGLNLFNKYATLLSFAKAGGTPGDIAGVVERGREVRLEASVRF